MEELINIQEYLLVLFWSSFVIFFCWFMCEQAETNKTDVNVIELCVCGVGGGYASLGGIWHGWTDSHEKHEFWFVNIAFSLSH